MTWSDYAWHLLADIIVKRTPFPPGHPLTDYRLDRGWTGFCHHPTPRPRSAFYDADTPQSARCPACGAMIYTPPPFPDQDTVEVRGL